MTVEQLRPTGSRREALYADPLLTGRLLLMALAVDHLIERGERQVRFTQVGAITGLDGWTVNRLLREDIPRYEPPARPERCQVVGPRGGVCPRPASVVLALLDGEDGTTTWVAACRAVTHRAWAEGLQRRHREALGVRVPPTPAYNTRSRLAHHFPEIDFPRWWPQIQAHAYRGSYDPARDPERGGAHLLQRPKLHLVP